MSSSDQEEKENSSQSGTSVIKSGELEKDVNKIVDNLSANVDTKSPTSKADEEYTYEEYEIEEYEEEEEEEVKNTHLLSPTTSKKGTFMTQNISTMSPSPPKQTKATKLQNNKSKSPNSSVKTKKTQKPQQVPPINQQNHYIDESEIEDKLNDFIQNGTMPDAYAIQPVLHLINRRKVDALLSSDYESAEVYENAAQKILTHQISQQYKSENQDNQNRQNRQQVLQNKLETTEDRYNQQIQSNLTECERRLEEAEKRHQEEISEFKNNWKNPDYVKQFSKPSSRMIQLRYVEKKLALAKRYNDAVSQRKLGDKQQLVETETLQKSLEKQMISDFTKMREKQRIEIERIEQHYDTLNAEIEAKKKKEMDTLNFAIRRNNESKPKNVNNRRNWSFSNSPSASNSFISSSGLESSLPTPRTKKKFNQYKQDRNVQIILTPFDDATLSKLPVSSFRSDKHKIKASNVSSRSSTALSTARSSPFTSARSKSSASKVKTAKSLNKSLNSRSHFPNLNS